MNIELKTSNSISRFRNILKIFFVACVYFLVAHFSLYLATLNTSASPVWPATGVSLFFVLIWGPQMSLGVLIGALAANLLTGVTPLVALAIGAGNSLESLAGIWLYRLFSGAKDKLGPHARIVVHVAVSTIATTISASFGTVALLVSNTIAVDTTRATWLTWWVGDTVGALILFPIAVKIYKGEFKPFAIPWKKYPLLVTTLATTIAACAFVFGTSFGAPYLFVIFAPLLLATMWLSTAWIYSTSVLICSFAILSTKQGLGPFYGGNLNENLLHLELFLAGVGLTAIVLTTLYQEKSWKMPSVALVFGWILTGMTFYSFYQSSVINDQEHFNYQVEKAEKDLRNNLKNYIRLLETGSGLFAASEEVTREEWHAFISRLRFTSEYPGINGIGVVVPVENKAQEKALIRHEQKTGFPDFNIHEVVTAPEEMKVANPPLSLVVRYIEPIEVNRPAVGLLASSERNRLEGALKARDTGLPTITNQITLMQDTRQRPGFVLFAPFYDRHLPIETIEQRRKAFQGLVFSPVVVDKFVASSLNAYGEELDLKIFFSDDMNPERQVFASDGWNDSTPYIKKSHTTLGELPVVLLWKRGASFKTQSSLVASWAGFCGSLISILLAILLSSLELITERAKKIAEERTYELSQREKELQLRQMALVASSRMSSLGQMAGGMAHEINNPLAIIAGKAQHLSFLLEEKPLNFDKASQHIQVINSNVERIAKIIKGLRSIARDVPNDPFREVRAKDIMQDTLELCRSRFKHHDIVLMTPENIDEKMICTARPEQIVQVLLNLMNNAFDAVENLPEKWVKLEVVQAGEKIRFSVTDSGQGLHGELSEKIFDPFFTTKDVGKGTGLGLSISRGIIEKHQGRLYIDEESTFTKFVVELDGRSKHVQEYSHS